MLKQLDRSALRTFLGAFVFFLIGGSLTTIVPGLTEASWTQPVPGLTSRTEAEERGRQVYIRDGCWYCHTQQIRTLRSDVERYGWREVDAPISLPGEYTEDSPHLLGTRRTGPDLARVGGKYDTDWHKSHFNNPRDQVPGSVMPPFPWLTQDQEEFEATVAYLQKLGRARDWRPDDDYEQ